MITQGRNDATDRLVARLSALWQDPQDRTKIVNTMWALDAAYDLQMKMAREPGVAEIIQQLAGRLANAYPTLADLPGRRILDIACGSNTSRMPPSVYVNTPFGEMTLGRSTAGYTAQFEPWFCRMLLELEAIPVGIDLGDLAGERFEHYGVDLGRPGALSFLPSHSFDAVQDSRLFGSPEFTALFPDRVDRLHVAAEICRQEQRLLKAGGLIIHSDAAELLGRQCANGAAG
jgi:hypothetical protein